MNYQKMKDYFLILQDKYGSPYHTDAEINLFLNRGQIDQVLASFPVDGGADVEFNANMQMRLAPLFFDVPATMLPVTGVVTKAVIQAGVSTPILRLLSVAYNGKPVKATRYNNWLVYLNNYFKAPTAANPRMYEESDSWVIRPVDSTAALIFYGVRYPVELLVDGTVACELPDYVHNDVVSRALEMAGVGSRDQMLSELKKLNAV